MRLISSGRVWTRPIGCPARFGVVTVCWFFGLLLASGCTSNDEIARPADDASVSQSQSTSSRQAPDTVPTQDTLPSSDGDERLVWLSPDGTIVHVGTASGQSQQDFAFDVVIELRPGGVTRDAVLVSETAGSRTWLLDLRTGTTRELDDLLPVSSRLGASAPGLLAAPAAPGEASGQVLALDDATVIPVSTPEGQPPLVSPDGEVVAHRRNGVSSDEIWLAERRSGRVLFSWETEPGWRNDGKGIVFSPDGSEVAFTTVNSTGDQYAVTILDLDDGSETLSLPTAWRFTYWLPDGSWLATDSAEWRRFAATNGSIQAFESFDVVVDHPCTLDPEKRYLARSATGENDGVIASARAELWLWSDGASLIATPPTQPRSPSTDHVLAVSTATEPGTVMLHFLSDGPCVSLRAGLEGQMATDRIVVGEHSALVQISPSTVRLIRREDPTDVIELTGATSGASWSPSENLLLLPLDNTNARVIDNRAREVATIEASAAVWLP